MKTVTVTLPSGAYDILIGQGLLKQAGQLAAKVLAPCKAAVITDDKVAALYGEDFCQSLSAAGFEPVLFSFPNGEEQKNSATYLSILNFLAEKELTRSDAVFALGGGVVGDLAGFAAATYLRGVSFIQCPTTLLAAVDSSVGGKTAIDLPAGKNLAGAFYQPKLVICDIDTLQTLDRQQYANGFGEIIKYGMICDRELINLLRSDVPPAVEEIIARCVAIKRDIVMQDEHDLGTRQLLNFGHTFGHAVERSSSFSIQHGSAVAIGMALITKGAVKQGICPQETLTLLQNLLERYDLPNKCGFSADTLFQAILSDKKRRSDAITLVLPEKAGKCFLKKLSLQQAKELLCLGLKED